MTSSAMPEPPAQRPVAFVMGSDSDLPLLEGAFQFLDQIGVGYHVRVLSAHRTPEEASAFARDAEHNGIRVLIALAGMAAHLAGAMAAHSLLPVLGVPGDSGPLHGQDALLSTVMMPPGVPVGTLGIGQSGAKNAAILAARILALSDPRLADRLRKRQQGERESILAKDRAVRERFKC
jgi:phosphoribosylaminoimidazole carboxylase PurE protein